MSVPLGQLEPSDAISRVLFEAVVAMSSDLDLHSVLARIVESAAELTHSTYGALGVLDAEGTLSDLITYGVAPEQKDAITEFPDGHGILGLVIAHPEPIRLEDLQAHPASYGFPAGHPPMKTFLGVPIKIRGTVFGNLYLTEKEGGYTDDDIALVQTLATAAGVGIERAQAVEDRAQLAVLSDRERIARDLHDLVIQRLFATGLSLQGLALKAPDVAGDIGKAVQALDQSIRDIRGTIFELQHRGGDSLRLEIRELVREYIPLLGFAPSTRLIGPVDTAIPGAIRPHLMAVLREALSNISRHAHARNVEIELTAGADVARIEILDDGVGVAPGVAMSGLRNISKRARDLGGYYSLAPRQGGGTVLTWEVPLKQD
ncbi:GAF domain-containing protein [Nocardioides sp.]|uniref:GAF domain-containing sensor histidine kinase n=1 Tax=Nocardioides sp. TaxID=35761 RepID=UPI002630358B|nr:GAF domain-containing protein [Nocardioides sp.]